MSEFHTYLIGARRERHNEMGELPVTEVTVRPAVDSLRVWLAGRHCRPFSFRQFDRDDVWRSTICAVNIFRDIFVHRNAVFGQQPAQAPSAKASVIDWSAGAIFGSRALAPRDPAASSGGGTPRLPLASVSNNKNVKSTCRVWYK